MKPWVNSPRSRDEVTESDLEVAILQVEVDDRPLPSVKGIPSVICYTDFGEVQKYYPIQISWY